MWITLKSETYKEWEFTQGKNDCFENCPKEEASKFLGLRFCKQ